MKRLFVVPNNDLEAKTIQEILKERGENFYVTNQQWGANFCNLEVEIVSKIESFKGIIYFVEIEGVPNKDNFKIIDHHGESSMKNTSSLEQVAFVIGYHLNETQELISQNDKAYFDGMLEYQLKNKIDFHTAKKKCMEIRAMDWNVQGITFVQKQQALKAVHDRIYQSGKCVIRCQHSKTAPIMDNMFWEDVEYIILSEGGEINIDATTSTIMKLNEKFPNSWFGGRLSYGKGYWGTTSYPQQEILDYFIGL